VSPQELPTSLREADLVNWIREPLDEVVDGRRRILFPPATAIMSTLLSDCQGDLLAQARRPGFARYGRAGSGGGSSPRTCRSAAAQASASG